MATDNRQDRNMESREAAQRPATYTPPAVLPEPKPVPGWRFKYVRVSAMGAADPSNVSSKLRDGWEPVKASECPELRIMSDNNPNSRFKDNIEIGGLLLCKAPEERVLARKAYYENLNRSQIEAVDNNFMREKDNRSNMRMFTERKTDVTFGRGNKS